MKITAVTKLKHEGIWSLLRKLGWSQSELGRRTGLGASGIGRIINLNFRPSPECADSIQKAFGEAGEYIDVLSEWPETFTGIKKGFKIETTADIPEDKMIDIYSHEALQLAAPESAIDEGDYDRVEDVLSSLSEKEAQVIRSRIFDGKTMAECAKNMKYKSAESVRQIEARALRKLRHPTRLHTLQNRDFLEV